MTLKKGMNLLSIEPQEGSFTFTRAVLSPQRDTLALLPDKDAGGNGQTAYLTVAPAAGYYGVFCETARLTVDGADAGPVDGSAEIYLRRGLNLLVLEGDAVPCAVSARRTDAGGEITPDQMTLTEPAAIAADGLLTGIGSAGGAAAFSVTAEAAGDYRVTLCCANNEEGGYHDYNVDLIEEYFTVTVNSETQTVMCRSTYSDETFSTVTFNAALRAGENEITLENDGSIRFDGRETHAPTLKWVTVNQPNRRSP